MKKKSLKILLNGIGFAKKGILLCLLFCIFVQSFPQGIVLCFENDGHMDVEFGSKNEFYQTFDNDFQESFTFISEEKDCNKACGICVDVPLYIAAEKIDNSKSIVLDQLILLLKSLPYLTTLTYLSALKNTFNLIPTTAFHISTTQTVILQV